MHKDVGECIITMTLKQLSLIQGRLEDYLLISNSGELKVTKVLPLLSKIWMPIRFSIMIRLASGQITLSFNVLLFSFTNMIL